MNTVSDQVRAAAGLPTTEATAALRAHPRFAAAFAAVLRDVVAVHRKNPLINKVLNDRGRVVFGIFAMYLHFSRDTGGLTASAMKTLCVETGLCSPGRATAMLSLMRFAGYVAPIQHPLDRRIRLLEPTDRLVGDHRQRLRAQLDALALLMPEGDAGLAHLDEDDFTAGMTVSFGEAFRAGFRVLNATPELSELADRNAGIVILMSLLLAGEVDDAVPPTRPVTISISALAKRFGVSRPHIQKFLRDAVAGGFIAVDEAEPQRITVLPRLTDAMEKFVANVLLFVAYMVRQSLGRVGQGEAAGSARGG
jgi:DNA-binding MarR family transcriptional regulator